MKKIETPFTKMMDIQYPIIAAPMFLVSNVDMVTAVSNAGGIGTFPALNYRPLEAYKNALAEMKAKTKNPIGVNVIVNKSNTRANDDIKYALDAGVELFITSLGSPKDVIHEAHKNGAKVICDVVNLEHAQKVQDLGADGVIIDTRDCCRWNRRWQYDGLDAHPRSLCRQYWNTLYCMS